MTEIAGTETILSRQLRMLSERSISDIVITTGLFDGVLVNYCRSLELPLHFTFVNNPAFKETNYIYSIYCARAYLKDDDVLLMHGDLVFEDSVLDDVLASAQAAQPLYKLMKADWLEWLGEMEAFCERNEVNCYAEKALNAVSSRMNLLPLDVHERLCCEVDNPQDLAVVMDAIKRLHQRTVYDE